MARLPEPTVSSDLYDETYFRTANWGYEEWASSEGKTIAPIYDGVLRKAKFRAGERVVDLGTGRGEMLVAATALGAKGAAGVEYSRAAVAMAEKTLAAHGLAADERVKVVQADARSTPLPAGEADLVTMVDVVEHLSPAELHSACTESLRLLRPGGRIIVHTMPNRLIYDVTYRLQRSLRPSRRRTWPADPRCDYERSMHVNEQTCSSLRKVLRAAGFADVDVRLGAVLYDAFVPDEKARRTYHRLAKLRLTEQFAIGDLWAEGRRRPPDL